MFGRSILALTVLTGAAMGFPAAVGDAPVTGATPAASDVVRGRTIAFTCPNISENDRYQVVMYPGQDDTSSGVGGVVATERSITRGVVRVRVPDIPELEGHVVRVKVFYMDDKDGKHVCDAGRIRLL